MASVRPLLRAAAPRLAIRTTPQHARFLNIETAPVLYTARASVTGGRANGHVKSDKLDLHLDMPKDMGGQGNGTNPEELFAAGYGACFQGAMAAVAPGLKITLPEHTALETKVHMIGTVKPLDLGIRVDMVVRAKGISQADLDKVVDATKRACPYSRATKGNVITHVKAIAE